MPPLRATALFCFLICYFTPNLHKWQAPIYDFVFSGVCFGRRFFFCPSTVSSYTGRLLPFRCLYIIVGCTFSETWSTLPQGGRAQRVSAPDAPAAGVAVERQRNGESPRLCRVRGGPQGRSASRPLMLFCMMTGEPHAYAGATGSGQAATPCGPAVRSL